MAATTPLSAVEDGDVFSTTEPGNIELKASGTTMSATEIQVMVLVDGFSTVAQIAQRVPDISREDVDLALLKLCANRLIVSMAEPEADATASGFATISVPAGYFSSLSADSSTEADGGVSILKRKGYYVRIARRPAEGRDRRAGWQPTILIVDDDADIQKLIGTYLKFEGLMTRAAFKRDDILLALRRQPTPDLILLDVNLGDANGFDILARMRMHPVLKSMPVIMLTAEATREAVLKGLQSGADGYITKPFEVDSVAAAVKAVLGLSLSVAKKQP